MSSGYLKFSQTGNFFKASEHYLVVGAEGKSSVFACSPCDLWEPQSSKVVLSKLGKQW